MSCKAGALQASKRSRAHLYRVEAERAKLRAPRAHADLLVHVLSHERLQATGRRLRARVDIRDWHEGVSPTRARGRAHFPGPLRPRGLAVPVRPQPGSCRPTQRWRTCSSTSAGSPAGKKGTAASSWVIDARQVGLPASACSTRQRSSCTSQAPAGKQGRRLNRCMPALVVGQLTQGEGEEQPSSRHPEQAHRWPVTPARHQHKTALSACSQSVAATLQPRHGTVSDSATCVRIKQRKE